jgi:hypothetical protein
MPGPANPIAFMIQPQLSSSFEATREIPELLQSTRVDSKQDEVYGWKASSSTLRQLEQRSAKKSSRIESRNTTHATQHNTTLNQGKESPLQATPAAQSFQSCMAALGCLACLHDNWYNFLCFCKLRIAMQPD